MPSGTYLSFKIPGNLIAHGGRFCFKFQGTQNYRHLAKSECEVHLSSPISKKDSLQDSILGGAVMERRTACSPCSWVFGHGCFTAPYRVELFYASRVQGENLSPPANTCHSAGLFLSASNVANRSSDENSCCSACQRWHV